jgi:hypothetical protein
MNKSICAYPGCNEPYCAKGYCMGHYQQMRRHGQASSLLSQKASLLKRVKLCSFSDCDRRRYHRQRFCKAHYAQKRKGQKLRLIRSYHLQ